MEQELPLRDIHLPEPISWWPPAPGWWVLLGLIVLLGIAVYWLVRRWRRRTVRKLALAELKAIEVENVPTPEKLRRVSVLMRRVALSVYPREEVAGLTGEAWLLRLDEPLDSPEFSRGAGRLLLNGPYQPAGDSDITRLLDLCREWLQRLPGKDSEPGRGRG